MVIGRAFCCHRLLIGTHTSGRWHRPAACHIRRFSSRPIHCRRHRLREPPTNSHRLPRAQFRCHRSSALPVRHDAGVKARWRQVAHRRQPHWFRSDAAAPTLSSLSSALISTLVELLGIEPTKRRHTSSRNPPSNSILQVLLGVQLISRQGGPSRHRRRRRFHRQRCLNPSLAQGQGRSAPMVSAGCGPCCLLDVAWPTPTLSVMTVLSAILLKQCQTTS